MDRKGGGFWHFFEETVKLVAICGGIVVILLMLVTVFIVIMRYIVRQPQAWAFDISLFLEVGLIFLGGPYILLHDGHIRIDTVLLRLPERTRLVMDIVAMIVILLFSILLTWSGVKEALENWGGISNSTAMLPTFPSYVAIPVGAFLMCMVCVYKIGTYVLLLKEKGRRV